MRKAIEPTDVLTRPSNIVRLADDNSWANLVRPLSAADSTGRRNDLLVSLEKWAETRFLVVAKGMPYLKQIRSAYEIKGVAWTGIAAEYKAIAPTTNCESHYFVLCLLRKDIAISFTIATETKVYEENEEFYRWLLRNKLDVYGVVRVSLPDDSSIH